MQVEVRRGRAVAQLDRDVRLELQRELGRAEHDPVIVAIGLVLGASVVKARSDLGVKAHAAPHRHHAAHDPLAMGSPARVCPTGMKSSISPTPSGVKKRVMRTLVSGKYSCLVVLAAQSGLRRQ